MSAPIGRSPILGAPRLASLDRQRQGWVLRADRRRVALPVPLRPSAAAWLCGHVDLVDVTAAFRLPDGRPAVPRSATVELLWHLAATGAILTAAESAAGAAAGSGAGAPGRGGPARPLPTIRPAGAAPPADPLQWEIDSVSGRREALAHLHPAWRQRPVSAVLITRRPAFLPRVLAMVAAQTQPLELIVGTHGFEVDGSALASAARGLEVRAFRVPTEQTLGAALSSAARMAHHDLITKFDDDDFYAATHVQDLVAALHYSGADLVGGPQAWVYVEADDVTVRRPVGGRTCRPESDSDWVAGGTILLGRGTAESVGYFSDRARAVDQYIFGEVLRRGGRVFQKHSLGYTYVRAGAGHTYEVDSAKYYEAVVAQYPGLIREPELGTGAAGTVAWREVPGGGFPGPPPAPGGAALRRSPADDARWGTAAGADLVRRLRESDHVAVVGTADRAGLVVWRPGAVDARGGEDGAAASGAPDLAVLAARGRVWRVGPWQRVSEPAPIGAIGGAQEPVPPGSMPGRIAQRLRDDVGQVRRAPRGLRWATARERAAGLARGVRGRTVRGR